MKFEHLFLRTKYQTNLERESFDEWKFQSYFLDSLWKNLQAYGETNPLSSCSETQNKGKNPEIFQAINSTQIVPVILKFQSLPKTPLRAMATSTYFFWRDKKMS